MKYALFALLASGMAGLAHAQGAETTTSVRAFASNERLSNGSPDWREDGLGVKFDLSPRQTLDLAAAEMHRFGIRDSQYAVNYSQPLDPKLVASLGATSSPSHQFLARQAFNGSLQYEFAHAWLVHAGMRHSGYDAVSVNEGIFLLEHYFSSFSWIVGWHPTRAYGTTANSFELRGTYYYGDRDSIGLIVSNGDEAASIPTGIMLTNVTSAALVGRHWLTPRWGLNYGATYSRQGDFYTRKGLNLGLQYAF
ncbi:MAG: YaiO family outer membrane beta-barrel protein [Rhodocyclaceae bacterium]|nr:YaiO family outer membrane beta-barrel protein [Rhodocyclaceae bacterium]